MAEEKKPFDFSGYATKYNIKCGDGRTIMPGAFKHMDGVKIPLVWQHRHDEVGNVLGHAILEHRDDGVYAYAYFNDTLNGITAKVVVQHDDIDALSIYANHLIEKKQLVHRGNIREMSLVYSGSNPGAFIENVVLAHSDGESVELEDEAIIYGGEDIHLNTEGKIFHGEEQEFTEEPKSDEAGDPEEVEGEIKHADGDMTLEEVYNTFTNEQKAVVAAMLSNALKSGSDLSQSDEEGETFMARNLFENGDEGKTLSHNDLEKFASEVFADAQKNGSFREAFLAHAGTYGIDDISYLFPDAQSLDDMPSFYTRRMGWVQNWMGGTRHVPFSRIKKLWADLTPDAARAKGYITGNQKVEQVFAVLKRTTDPTTVYKKQKLDRDDKNDITDFDVVAWMWREMRFMLDEEVARAGLVGDGRTFGTDDDAIDPSKIRPVFGDDPLFVHYLTLEATVTDYNDIIDAILTARVNYRGTGTPVFYTTNTVLNGMLLLRDGMDRRMYKSIQELASELRVSEIIEVEVMEGVQRDNTSPAFTADLLGIMINPADYTYGADKGGQVSTFEQFDIDYNQDKFLIETRVSGSLLNPKSAMVVERKTA